MSKSRLKFGIDIILQPDFGSTSTSSDCSNSSCTSSPSSSFNTSPICPTAMAAAVLAEQRTFLPPWVYCTRYSDRPSAGSRIRKPRKKEVSLEDEKRPRTAFTSEQLDRLKKEFENSKYLTEKRRQVMAHELGLNESQIKIWFQNKRAKQKKNSGERTPLAMHMLSHEMYNPLRQ